MFQVIRSKDCLIAEGLHGVVKFELKVLQMKKILGLLVLVSGLALGQDIDTVVLDTTKRIPNYFGGVSFDVGIKLAPNPPGINEAHYLGAGIQYNKWSFGFMVYDFKGTIERQLIFPNVFELAYRYGGPQISFEIQETKWANIYTQISYSKGDMTWRNIEDDKDFLRSEFDMWTFSMKLETDRLRFVRPYLNGGYQHLSKLKLNGLSDSDFSGFFFGLGVRLGYFNQ